VSVGSTEGTDIILFTQKNKKDIEKMDEEKETN